MARKPDQQARGAKRQEFVDATLVCLAEYGYHGTTVRKIADAAGVTAGLVTHYFTGKDELVAASYRHLNESALKHSLFESAKAGKDPKKRLEAFIRAYFFSSDGSDRKQMRIWVSFWGLVITNPDIAIIQAEKYLIYRQEISNFIEIIYTAKGTKLSRDVAVGIATGIIAIVDGLWLECCLDPGNLSPTQATKTALEFIGGRLDISFVES